MAEESGADVATRGSLHIHDRVPQRIATKAARETRGVQIVAPTLQKLTGRELPRVHVAVSGSRVRATVDIAVQWPHRLAAVAAEVRGNVSNALSGMAGLQVDGVDVVVADVLAAAGGGNSTDRSTP